MKRKRIYLIILSLFTVWSLFPEYLKALDAKQGITYDKYKQVDVIVCGTEPEGIAAAVAAARKGLKTLIIDKRSYPGGLYTAGMLTMLDLNIDNGNEELPIVNQGLFAKMYEHIGTSGVIDVEQAKSYFRSLLANYNIEALYEVSNIKTEMNGKNIATVYFNYGERVIKVEAKYVIDAMQDAPVARMSGADYWVGREDLGLDEYACSTLVFSVKGVKWDEVYSYLKYDGDPLTGCSKKSAWGYKELLQYEPVTSQDAYQLRGLNLAKQNDGSVVINAFQIFGVNSLSEKSKKSAYEAACKEVPYIVSYLRKTAKGFENAQISRIADELYIREGVRIVGVETLTAEDYFSNKDFNNKIAYGSYPIDLQSVRKDTAGGNGLSGRNIYTIPMGVMLPTKLDNVLVVGRSASYDSLVHGSARTVPVGVALGEAAGEACALSLKQSISLKAINSTPAYYKALQNNLMAQGVTLNESITAHNEEVRNWSYGAIQNLRKQGLLIKDSRGKTAYGCNELATYDTFRNIASLAKFHSTLAINCLGTIKPEHEDYMTVNDVLEILNQILGKNYTDLKEFVDQKILQEATYKSLLSTDKIYNSQAYVVMNDVIQFLRKKNPLPSKESIIHNDLA